MHQFLDDVRRAYRRLRRSPRLSLIAIGCFALGTGAHMMLFGMVDTLASIAPTPVLNPARVVRLQVREPGSRAKDLALSRSLVGRFRAEVQDVAEIAEAAGGLAPVVGHGVRRRTVTVMMVSGNYFGLLGARPALGRWFTPDEDKLYGGANVAVLSDAFWRGAFAADSAILGAELEIARRQFTVVGVAPNGFPGAELASADLWIPANRIRPATPLAGEPAIESSGLPLLARIRGNLTPPQAEHRMNLAYQRATSQDTSVLVLLPAGDARATGAPRFQWAGGLLVALLLAVTAGGANLFLLRAFRPRKEAAVRAALGAGARPLVALLALDVFILMTVGIALGLLAAFSVQSVAETYSLADPMRIGGVVRLLGPLATIAIVAGALASILPALRTAEDDAGGPGPELTTLFGPRPEPSTPEHSPQLALVRACPCPECRKRSEP